MEYGTLKHWADIVEEKIQSRSSITYCVIGEQTVVSYGMENDCDVQWCEANHIPAYNIHRSAGCCVCATGSVNIADIRKHKGEFVENRILRDFADWLSEKGIAAELNHNDILVDGKKVAAAGGYNLAPDFTWQYTGIQISINQDYEVIANACKKPSTKKPGALSDYGITTDEVVAWCKKWFEDYDGGGA